MDSVKLDLGVNNIDDEGMQLLTKLVSRMSSLKCLSLGDNRSVTPSGWQALTGYLRNPNFSLRELRLDENDINDDTVVAFAKALKHNKTLKILNLYKELDSDFDDDEDGGDVITERGWEAVSSLLCNKTTIMDTYNSNHMLQELGNYHDEMNLPNDLVSHLEMNTNEDKIEVARQKILQTHFSTEYDTASNIQKMLDMDLVMLPSAIAWIGRTLPISWEGTQVSGLSTMFNLMRRVPDLFDSSPQQMNPPAAKRKR